MSKLMKKPDLRGVTVATVLPFKDDSSIDWDGYARVLDYCACPDGIAAVFVNGHAGEGGSLSDDERQAVIERTRRQIGSKPLNCFTSDIACCSSSINARRSCSMRLRSVMSRAMTEAPMTCS